MQRKLLRNSIFLGLAVIVVIGIMSLTININNSGDLLSGMAGANEQAVPCQISANLRPASGVRLPQNLKFSASDANGCNLPMKYTWDCSSPNTQSCPEFLSRANVSPNGISNPTLRLGSAEIFNISLTICEVGNPNNCSSVYGQYIGAEET